MMKLFLKTIALAATIALLPLTMFAQTMLFTEIMYDLPGSDEKREWCELYNFGTEAVTVVPGTTATSWRFHDTSAHTLKLIQGDATLLPGATAILTSDSTTWLAEHPGFSGTIFDTVMSLSNASGTIALSTSSAGTPFTSLLYEATWGAAGNGFSLERDSLDSASIWRDSGIEGGTPGMWAPFIVPLVTTTPTTTPDDMTPTTTPTSTDALNDEESASGSPAVQIITITPQPQAEVRINEIMPNPEGSDTDAEWIELHNASDFPAELNDWTLQDGSTVAYTFSSESADRLVIAPGQYLVVKRSQTKIALNNTGGDTLRLTRADGSLADAVSYFDSAKEGVAWARFDESWEWSLLPTPGAENMRAVSALVEDEDDDANVVITSNSAPVWSPPPERSIILTEIFPNQKGADTDEWIEIGNVSSSTIDLTGWKLDDADGGSKPYAFPQGLSVESGSYSVFKKNDTKLLLGNAKDTVRLITPIGSVWQNVSYTSAPEDESYAYDSGDDDWIWTSAVTPGSSLTEQESVMVLGVDMAEESMAQAAVAPVLYGIVIIPPKTLYKQRMYVQALDDSIVPTGSVVEIYNYKGSFPSVVFGEKVAAVGEIAMDKDVPQMKTVSAEDIQSVDTPGEIRYTAVENADVALVDQYTPVSFEGMVLRRSDKSLRVGDSDEAVVIRSMDAKEIFGEELAKDSRVRIAGIVKQQNGTNVVYVPNAKAIEIMAAEKAGTISVDSQPASEERIIEGAIPESPLEQWYILLIAPGVAIAGFVVKKYVLPRLS